MARIGVVPEDPDAPPGMTAAQLSRFFAALYPRWDDDRFGSLTAEYGLPMRKKFKTLSFDPGLPFLL